MMVLMLVLFFIFFLWLMMIYIGIAISFAVLLAGVVFWLTNPFLGTFLAAIAAGVAGFLLLRHML